MTNNNDYPGRGFFIFLACLGIYSVISIIIDSIDVMFSIIFR